MNPLLHLAAVVAGEFLSSVLRSSADELSVARVEQAGRGEAGCLSWLGLAIALAVVVLWLTHTGLPLPSFDVAGQLAGRR